ncbi:MAG: hypothetical protein QGI86_17305 [Candidatus Poribacteria bacterium]|nr:hypothetical protein [Candidatus Poribacteria bacterium]
MRIYIQPSSNERGQIYALCQGNHKPTGISRILRRQQITIC